MKKERYEVLFLDVENLPYGDAELTDDMYTKAFFPNKGLAFAHAKRMCGRAYAEVHVYRQISEKAHPTSYDWDYTTEHWLFDESQEIA